MVAILEPVPERPLALLTADDARDPLALDPALVVALYKAHGALLLRGFDLDLDRFRHFTAQFCSGSVFNESPDRRVLDADHGIQSVNGGTRAFPLHPELSREPWKPDVCFFACLVPPRTLGATTICDGIELVRRLPAEVRDGLAGRRLVYNQLATPETLRYWLGTATPDDSALAAPPPACPYAFWRAGEHVVRSFSRPALHRPMFADGPAFGNFLLFARFFNEQPGFPVLDDGRHVPEHWLHAIRTTGERLSLGVAWRQGDLLMLDNTRFMHGRTAVTDPDTRLIASYFGYLDFARPDPEEPAGAPWRTTAFRPPQFRVAVDA
jgi:alpha-ketoglutarate-dependent taurine dioxygenase